MDYFESGVFGNNIPAWHGKGTVVQGALSTKEALTLGGLDWLVEKRPLFTPRAGGGYIAVPDRYGIVRVTDESPLGVVGSKYQPIQNAQAFDFVDFLTGDKTARWETAISIKGGSTIAGLLSLRDTGIEIRKGDKHYHFLTVITTHDGTGSAKVFPTDVRVVCANTVQWALGSRDRGLTVNVRHSGNVSAKAADAARVLATASDHFVLFEEWLRKLTEIKVTKEAYSELENILFPPADETSDRSKTIRANKVMALKAGVAEEIKLLPQFTVTGAGFSAYEIFNGVTRYIDHSVASGKKDAFEYALLGSGNDFKQKAIKAIEDVFDVPVLVAAK